MNMEFGKRQAERDVEGDLKRTKRVHLEQTKKDESEDEDIMDLLPVDHVVHLSTQHRVISIARLAIRSLCVGVLSDRN